LNRFDVLSVIRSNASNQQFGKSAEA
jgi:hypothetical protein